MKKEIPLLFSTPMVQAILEGRKTMTRRTRGLKMVNDCPDDWEDVFQDVKGDWFASCDDYDGDYWQPINCPYGKPGDLLWVRESVMPYQPGRPFIYRTEVTDEQIKSGAFKFKPSIHMPKTAARIWLEVTGVRVERLQEISEQDAKAEGIEYKTIEGGFPDWAYKNYINGGFQHLFPKESFTSLWIKINGEESWNQNPWVWVLNFKVLSTTGRPAETLILAVEDQTTI
jgi:hypothetical protein